jgi:hypothetical protein
MSHTSNFGGTRQTREHYLEAHPTIIQGKYPGTRFDRTTQNGAKYLQSGDVISIGAAMVNTNAAQDYGIDDRFVVEYKLKDGASLYYDIVKEDTKIGTSPYFKGAHELRIHDANDADGARKPFQFLPWEEHKITWMKLEMKPGFFITGPLSGCQVYVATRAGKTYVYHANSNAMGGSDQAALKRPDLSIDYMDKLYAKAAQNGATLTHRLCKDDYVATREVRQGNGAYVTELTDVFSRYKTAKETSKKPHRTARTDVTVGKGSSLGFVFGVHAGNGWSFYYHACALLSYGRGWFRFDVKGEFKVVVPCASLPTA